MYRCNFDVGLQHTVTRSMSASALYRLTASAGVRFLTLVSSASLPSNSSASEITSSSTAVSQRTWGRRSGGVRTFVECPNVQRNHSLTPMCAILIILLLFASSVSTNADHLPREQIETYICALFSLGEVLNDKGVYSLLNSGGIEAGYVFESEPLAPLPGFSGSPINILVVLDLEGRFLNVQLIEHNEPIFVSGLGEAPFHNYFEQYGGCQFRIRLLLAPRMEMPPQAHSLFILKEWRRPRPVSASPTNLA